MLTRSNRFHSSRAIQRLYKQGRAARTRYLGLKYTTVPNGVTRAATVVSKKVHKSAVVRNRIRRRIYEILRKSYIHQLQGVELVVTVFDVRVAFMSADDLYKEVTLLLSKDRLVSGEDKKRGIVNTSRQHIPSAHKGRN